MTGIIILVGIIVLISLLLLSYIKLYLIYDQNGITVSAGIWFIRFRIAGGEKKKINKKAFKINKFRAKCKRTLKKYEKKHKKKNAEPAAEKKKDKNKKSSLIPSSPKELIQLLREILGVIIKRFPKYLHIKCKTILLSVGGKDAHDVAIKYGETVQALQYLISFLGEATNLTKTHNSEIAVYPDFASGKWDARVNIEGKIRILSILKLGAYLIAGFLRFKKQSKGRTLKSSDIAEKNV